MLLKRNLAVCTCEPDAMGWSPSFGVILACLSKIPRYEVNKTLIPVVTLLCRDVKEKGPLGDKKGKVFFIDAVLGPHLS